MYKVIIVYAMGIFAIYRQFGYRAQLHKIQTYQNFISHKNLENEYSHFYTAEIDKMRSKKSADLPQS